MSSPPLVPPPGPPPSLPLPGPVVAAPPSVAAPASVAVAPAPVSPAPTLTSAPLVVNPIATPPPSMVAPNLFIQVPVVDVRSEAAPQLPVYRRVEETSNWPYWLALIVVLALLLYLIYAFWTNIVCFFKGCPGVKQINMLDNGCDSYMNVYCNCCTEPIRICCSDPWVKQQFSHWSDNPAINQLLLDGACQRLFGDRTAKHQVTAQHTAAQPPCIARPPVGPQPTPLGPAPAPPQPAPSPVSVPRRPMPEAGSF